MSARVETRENGPPEGWAQAKLAVAGDWCTGGTPSRKRAEYFGGTVPWVKSGDLRDGIVTSIDETITDEGLKSSAAKLLPVGTVSIALYGATIGKVGILGIDAATNQACASCQVDEQIVYREFLFYYLLSERQAFIDAGQGGAQPNLSNKIVREWPFRFPPLAEQKRIVAMVEKLLARVNAARDRLAKVPAILKRFRQSVLAAACSGRLTTDWRDAHPDIEPASELVQRVVARRKSEYEAACRKAKRAGERLPKRPTNLNVSEVDASELPEIHEPWTWVYLPHVGYMNRGKSRHRPRNAPHLYGGPYPFIQTGDIAQSGGRITNHRQTYSEEGLAQSRLWRDGTICITIAANIADSAILTYAACFPDSVVGVIPDDDLCSTEYVEYFIRTARDDLSQFAPATAQKNINIRILNDIAVPLPPLEEQHEIVRRVEALFKLADTIEQRVTAGKQRADKLTQAILAKAFRGELVPTEAELARREGRPYEPASVLLERIKAERQAAEATKPKRSTRQPQKSEPPPS